MKRLCKNAKIDVSDIEQATKECLRAKWTRNDTLRFLAEHSDRGMKELKDMTMLKNIPGQGMQHRREELSKEIHSIAVSLKEEIDEKKITLNPIIYRERFDGSSRKTRVIGTESIKQQILDYVAVNGLMELLKKKIGANQFACVPGRGQLFGKKRIEKWIREYPEKCKYVAKADVKKCYPSVNKDILKAYLRKWVKNERLIYLTETLIDTYDKGLLIGSYLSLWLCNLYLSIAYHYASEDLVKTRKKRNGVKVRKRLAFKVAFYMDDIVLIGPRKKDVYKALRMLSTFMKDRLDLELKEDWRVFELGGKNSGQPIDIMGYKIYKDTTTIRSTTFLKIRRAYKKANDIMRKEERIPVELARRCVSYYGKVKHTDSFKFAKEYNIEQTIRAARRAISDESKILTKTACSEMAATQ